MRRVLRALGLVILGGGIMWVAGWLHEYFYPEVIAADEKRVAEILASFAYDAFFDFSEKQSTGSAPSPGLTGVAVCVARNHPGPVKAVEFFQAVSYFRSLAKPWDPRGALLDRSWAKAAVRRYANGVFFGVDVLEGSAKWQHFLTIADGVASAFYRDCRDVPHTENWIVARLVAVSPAIKNPYCVFPGVESCFGFFVAMEATFPDGRTRRSVEYCPRHFVSRKPYRIYDAVPCPVRTIPEAFWRHDFGSWKSIKDVAREIPSVRDKEWYDEWYHTIFPGPIVC